MITDERGGQQRNKVGPFIPSRRPISAARKHVAIITWEAEKTVAMVVNCTQMFEPSPAPVVNEPPASMDGLYWHGWVVLVSSVGLVCCVVVVGVLHS